jgi:hypothetical protein
MEDDCAHEFCLVPPPALNALNLPSTSLRCTNDDPACDLTLGDDVCTFQLALCYRVDDDRIPCSAPAEIGGTKVRQPGQPGAANVYDRMNRDAVHAALLTMGGGACKVKEILFVPPLTTTDQCSPMFQFKVPLKPSKQGLRARRKPLRLTVFAPKIPGQKQRKDLDMLDLTCEP